MAEDREPMVQDEETTQAPDAALRALLHQISVRQYPALLEDGRMPSDEEQRFLDTLQPVVEQMEKQLDACAETEPPQPVNAQCRVGLSADLMQTFALFFPPAFGGSDLQMDEVKAALAAVGVTYGIDEAVLFEAAQEQKYGKLLLAAHGLSPVNGVDGKVTELFEREKKASFRPDAADKVNYKNLNMIQQVRAGEPVCNITPATEGTDGMTVRGAAVRAVPGRSPMVPMGRNTEVNPGGTALLAQCDGQVIYANQGFHVEQVLEIKGDVDNTVGNVDAIGHVKIHGNVQDGYTVKATGDITVFGIVEGATLVAKGSIQVKTGVKGNMHGMLEANKDIQSKFIENCSVKAGGVVSANMIINSTVKSGERVEVLTGRGTIVGGEITARDAIRAKTIGNETNRKITLSVGTAPDYWEKKKQMGDELETLRRAIDEADKNITYLEHAPQPLAPKYQQLLGDLRLKQSVNKMQEQRTSKALQKLIALQNPAGSRIEANVLYPPATVNIGKLARSIHDTQNMCMIFLGDGDIMIGSK